MAQEIRRFAVTVAAGTAIATPATTNMTMPPRVADEVEIRVPPGPRGEVGFALAMAGTQLIPLQTGQYIVTDDEELTWRLDGYPDSGAWQLIAYNTGSYPHVIEVRFLLSLPKSLTGSGFQPLPAAELSQTEPVTVTTAPGATASPGPSFPSGTGVAAVSAPAPAPAPVPLPEPVPPAPAPPAPVPVPVPVPPPASPPPLPVPPALPPPAPVPPPVTPPAPPLPAPPAPWEVPDGKEFIVDAQAAAAFASLSSRVDSIQNLAVSSWFFLLRGYDNPAPGQTIPEHDSVLLNMSYLRPEALNFFTSASTDIAALKADIAKIKAKLGV